MRGIMTIIIVILVNVCKLTCRQSCGRRTHWPFAEASEQANKRTSVKCHQRNNRVGGCPSLGNCKAADVH